MTPIAFNAVSRLSNEDLNAEERTHIAEEVYNVHGVEGLVTLWACQDFYDPEEPLFDGFTPATSWWLMDNNHYADMVREKLSVLSEADALEQLKSATLPPIVELNKGAFAATSQTLNIFTPEQRGTFSNTEAATVMTLAKRFFPQYPQLVQPMCSLYMDAINYDDHSVHSTTFYPVHGGTLKAFANDAAALQYLVRAHTGNSVRRHHATAAMNALLLATDGEWAMYETMGVSLENGYAISKNARNSTLELILPSHFETELST